MRTAPALLIAALLAGSLSGCFQSSPVVLPEPEPSVAPIFASEEEALAAAEDAYGAYLGVLDLIMSEGGADPQRLADVATGDVLGQEVPSLERFAQRGHRTIGATQFDSFSLQQYDEHSSEATVIAYVCEDFSEVDVLDDSGVSVAGPDRRFRWPLVISFDFVGGALLVENIEDWDGDDFCV